MYHLTLSIKFTNVFNSGSGLKRYIVIKRSLTLAVNMYNRFGFWAHEVAGQRIIFFASWMVKLLVKIIILFLISIVNLITKRFGTLYSTTTP